MTRNARARPRDSRGRPWRAADQLLSCSTLSRNRVVAIVPLSQVSAAVSSRNGAKLPADHHHITRFHSTLVTPPQAGHSCGSQKKLQSCTEAGGANARKGQGSDRRAASVQN